jgi:aspartyl protease family protein
MRRLKRQLDDAVARRTKLEQQIKQAKDAIANLDAQLRDTEQRLARVKQSDVETYNAIVGQGRKIDSNIRDGGLFIEAREAELSKLNVPTGAYVAAAQSLSDSMESAAKRYDELSKDTEVASALARIQNGGAKVKLGPSAAFTQELTAIRQQNALINRTALKFRLQGGVPVVDVTLNGRLSRPMVVDSGAASMTITWDTAEQLGITPGPNDPVAHATVADGKVVEVKVVQLRSVRLGQFSAQNVRCDVFPKGVSGGELLGGTFLRNFAVNLDLASGELRLAQVAATTQSADVKVGGATGLVGDNCRAGLAQLDTLLAAEDYSGAARLVSGLQAVAATDPMFNLIVQHRTKEVEALRTGHEAIARDLERLKASPADPAANAAVGQFLCFTKGDWERGLPMLAKSSDAAVQRLASDELASPANDALQKLADGWWELADKQSERSKANIRRHAASLYARLPTTSALRTGAMESRIAQTRTMRLVDLLPAVDAHRDAVAGGWGTDDQGLSVDSAVSRIEFPYKPPEEYILRAEFTPLSGSKTVYLSASKPSARTGFGVLFGAADNTLVGIDNVGGRRHDVNPTRVQATKWLDAGRRSIGIVEVRDGRVRAWLDNRLVIDWKTDFDDLSYADWQRPRDLTRLAVGTWLTATTFHHVEVLELPADDGKPPREDLQARLERELAELRKKHPTGLVIIEARWGVPGKWKDVAAILRAAVSGDMLDFKPTATALGDPAPGAFKRLILSYHDGEQIDTIEFGENYTLHICAVPSKEELQKRVDAWRRERGGNGLIILDAQWGADGRWLDLRDQLQRSIKNNVLKATVGDGYADPAQGAPKELRLVYWDGAQIKSVRLKDRAELNLRLR